MGRGRLPRGTLRYFKKVDDRWNKTVDQQLIHNAIVAKLAKWAEAPDDIKEKIEQELIEQYGQDAVDKVTAEFLQLMLLGSMM